MLVDLVGNAHDIAFDAKFGDLLKLIRAVHFPKWIVRIVNDQRL